MNLVPFLSRRRAWALALAVVLGSAPAQGQQRTLGTAGGSLSIDFRAFTADGKPVADLSPADVTVRIGSKVRTVTALTMKRIEPAERPVVGGAVPPPFSTNEPVLGRSILIVVDTESLEPGTEPAVKAAIERLLKGLTSADRVAFSIAPRDSAQVGFGAGLARVRETVAALSGQRPATASAGLERCRTQDSLTLLKSLLQPLAGNEMPTSVVFIAADMSTPSGDQRVTVAQTATTANERVVSCDLRPDEFQAIGSAAAEARANVYVVQGDVRSQSRSDGLENLASVTGAGPIMRVSGDGFAPRVLADASTYWVATVAGDPSDRSGPPQRLEIKAVREGVTVQARPEVSIPRAGARPASTSPRDMIRSPAAFTDLPLRATAIHSRGQGDKMAVLVLAEPVDPTVKIAAMTVGYFDAAGQGGSTSPNQVATYPIGTVVGVGVGQYRIRVAATDPTGRSGAVDILLDTALAQAGSLKLGSLLLGVSKGDAMSPKLLFGSEEKILAYMEIYGQMSSQLGANFEIAASENGPAIDTFPAGGRATSEPDKFILTSEIPIAKLAPGDYIVRALVQLEGQAQGRVVRSFRKVAK